MDVLDRVLRTKGPNIRCYQGQIKITPAHVLAQATLILAQAAIILAHGRAQGTIKLAQSGSATVQAADSALTLPPCVTHA
jgi:hypothetical protein